jgi:hypothetical protein
MVGAHEGAEHCMPCVQVKLKGRANVENVTARFKNLCCESRN